MGVWRWLILALSVVCHVVLLWTSESLPPQLSGGSHERLSVSLSIRSLAIPQKPKHKMVEKKEVEAKLATATVNSEKVAKKILAEKKELEKKDPAEAYPLAAASQEVESVLELEPVNSEEGDRGATKKIGIKSLPVITAMTFKRPPIQPHYPKLALRKRQQGEALVHVLVNEFGDTEKVELKRSTGYALLDRSALAAVSDWQFNPATENKHPIRAWMSVPVVFAIN